MKIFICVYLCLASVSNVQSLEEFRQKIITELKDYFREDLNRIENKYAEENRAFREEVATSRQELNELKLKLNHERQERTQEIARLQHKQSVVIKELHDLKLQFNAQRTKTCKIKGRLTNNLALSNGITEGDNKLKTNPNVAENNVTPFEAETSKVGNTNHTHKNTLQSKSMEATWKQKSRFDGASLDSTPHWSKKRQAEGKNDNVFNSK